VLVTRALQDAAPLARALADVGFDPVVVPLLERRFRMFEVAAAAGQHPRVDVVFVTSAAAADAVAVGAPNAWRDAVWAAVGPATERRLRSLGYRVGVVPERATALDLVAALGDLSEKVVAWPKGDLGSESTSVGLLGTGARVVEFVAYDNVAPPGHAERLIGALPVDATTLLSGSAAERLAEALPPERRPELGKVVCVGPSTAEVALRVGLRVDAVASPHTVAGVVAAAAAILKGW
jgi:uroporphyrinogen-III synthase